MSKLFTIWRREMAACFLSPVAYVTMVAYLGMTGFTFWFGALRAEGKSEPLSLLLVGDIVFWLPILVTVVSMRLFAEERRSGTIETLMTAPVSDLQVVLGKYFGALTFLGIVIAPTFGYAFILERLSPGLTTASLDVGAIGTGALGVFLVTAALLAVSLTVSLMTRNQIVSAICSFVVIWLVLLAGWLLGHLPGIDPELCRYLSAMVHIEDLARGILDPRPICLALSVSGFMLFAATRILESRHWR